MNLSKRGRFLLTISVVLILFVIVATVIHSNTPQEKAVQKANTISINGLTGCSANINTTVLDGINSQLYSYIKEANSYNKVSSLSTYQGVIRKGSCQQLAGSQDDSSTKTTSIIVDVPTAKQSWKVTYSWVPNNTEVTTDLGQIIVDCPSSNQLIYGDFHCTNVLSLLTTGTTDTETILQYMPYTGAGFNLTYDPDTKTVDASIIVKPANQTNQILINNIEAQVQDWFTTRSLNINNYTVIYTIVTDDDGL
jgi:hypothetical protein